MPNIQLVQVQDLLKKRDDQTIVNETEAYTIYTKYLCSLSLLSAGETLYQAIVYRIIVLVTDRILGFFSGAAVNNLSTFREGN